MFGILHRRFKRTANRKAMSYFLHTAHAVTVVAATYLKKNLKLTKILKMNVKNLLQTMNHNRGGPHMGRDAKTQVTIDELKKYNGLKALVENLNDEIIMLDTSMKSSGGSFNSIPIHGGTCRQEEKLIKGIDKKQLLENQLRENEMKVKIIERTLSTLSERERRVLEVTYIYNVEFPIDILCEELNVEEITIHRIKRRALQKYAEMRWVT